MKGERGRGERHQVRDRKYEGWIVIDSDTVDSDKVDSDIVYSDRVDRVI